jgi:CRISPR-associated endoribonuclease Cas6
MRQILIKVRPKDAFEVPHSDGYQIYSALLALIKSVNPEVSERLHGSSVRTTSIGGLHGNFEKSNKSGFKRLARDRIYTIRIGVIDSHEEEFFQNLVYPILLERRNIVLDRGELCVEHVEDRQVSHTDLFRKVAEYAGSTLEINFLTPTCIQYKNSKVTEMFPQRIAVFHSILSKWNQACPDGYRMDINRDEFGRYLIEKPDVQSYTTYSVLVNTVFDRARGHARPIFKQGFVGRCGYSFTPDAPKSFWNAVAILALFSEFSGVGSSVARGCGQVSVSLEEKEA